MRLRHVFLHMSLYIYNEAFASLDSYFSILNLSCSPCYEMTTIARPFLFLVYLVS